MAQDYTAELEEQKNFLMDQVEALQDKVDKLERQVWDSHKTQVQLVKVNKRSLVKEFKV